MEAWRFSEAWQLWGQVLFLTLTSYESPRTSFILLPPSMYTSPSFLPLSSPFLHLPPFFSSSCPRSFPPSIYPNTSRHTHTHTHFVKCADVCTLTLPLHNQERAPTMLPWTALFRHFQRQLLLYLDLVLLLIAFACVEIRVNGSIWSIRSYV